MKLPSLLQVRGVVTVVVRGDGIERLINELSLQNVEIWDLKSLTEQTMEMNIGVADFFQLRPLLKRTGCRIRIKERTGLPFVMIRLWSRKWFLFGFSTFIVIIFCLSSLVWDIQVVGNDKIATEDVLNAAHQEGIHQFQWIFRLPEQDKLSANLTKNLPGSSWVGVSRTGTRITIQVVEATEPAKELLNPRHFISKSDGVVTYIYAEKGQPEVKKNDRVRKGQILISGIQGGKMVVSKGEVRGNVWHEYNIEVPLVRKQKVYTGDRKQKGYLYFGNTAIQLTGYGKINFQQSQTLTELDPLTWRSLKLKMGWMTENVLETTEVEFKISQDEAMKTGIEHAKRDIIAKNGPTSLIINQNILHEKTDNGKVYMKVLFEVEQNIAEELPIVYDQGE